MPVGAHDLSPLLLSLVCVKPQLERDHERRGKRLRIVEERLTEEDDCCCFSYSSTYSQSLSIFLLVSNPVDLHVFNLLDLVTCTLSLSLNAVFFFIRTHNITLRPAFFFVFNSPSSLPFASDFEYVDFEL